MDAATTFPQLATMLRLDYLLVTLLSLMAWGLVLYQQRLGRYAGGFLPIVYVAYLFYRIYHI